MPRAGGCVEALRIAHVAPVATTVPPPKSGSVEAMTSLLTEGLVAKGHDVTLFATAGSKTRARLHATFDQGYWHDTTMWPWELYEMLNLAAAVERAGQFDLIHYEAASFPMSLAFTRLSPVPIVQTLHHSPGEAEVRLWSRYPEAPFVAISKEQACLLRGANVVGTVLHGIDTDAFEFRETPDDYLLFLGRFTAGKGVLQAIEVARRASMKLILVAAEDAYYREAVAPHVDGTQSSTSARPITRPRFGSTAAPERCSTRCRRASHSAWSSPRPWRAARRWRRWTAERCAR